MTLKGAVSHRVALGTDARENITRLDNALAGIPERLERANEQLNNLYNQQEAAKEEVERIHEKMDELGIRSMGAYLRKMALDGYCIRLDLQDVKALVSLLRICSNNLNQYAKRANETGSIYHADIEDLQKRLEEIWTDMREVLVRLSSIQ